MIIGIFGSMFFMILAGWFFFWFMFNWARFDNPKISGWTLLKDLACIVLCFWCSVQLAGTLV